MSTATELLDSQVIHVKRGRFNGFGFEPAWSSFFDFYHSAKYISPPLLELQDVTFFLFLRKNLNDKNPNWKMPTIRQIKKKFLVSQGKIEGMITRLEQAHLLKKVSGLRTGQENERNDYLLADPVQTLEEFLTIARESLFPRGLNPEWAEVCTDNRYMVYPPSVQGDVPEIGTDQQTLKTEQGVWDSVLTQLQFAVPQSTFAVFLQGTELLSIADGVATVGTPRPHACDWLQVQMAPRIKKVLAAELSARNDATSVSEVRCVVKTE